jgi:flagellin
MSMVLSDNITSLDAQYNLGRSESMLSTSLQRLSTGTKLNSAADGPAAFVISQEQQAQMAGLQAAINNTANATSMVQTTEGALGTINNLLTQMRSIAVDSANSGVYDASDLAANQAQIASALSTINSIAANTQFGTKHLLDGSAGINGASDNGNTTFVNAQNGSPTGTFAVNITSAGTRANVTAGTAQTGALAANETLTINGVSVQLTAGETQAQVIGTINQYTGQTGVTAVNNGGATQLYTTQFGSAAKIAVQSNVAASGTSSGFGVNQISVQGTDISGTLGGFAAFGQGNILTGNAGGGAAGISISEALAGGSNTSTATGAQGNVTLTNNSLVFQLGANANQTASITVNKVAANALGMNVAGSQFSSLANINVQSQSGAQDAIKVIDQAISDITALQGLLGAFQSQTLASTQANLNSVLQNTTQAEANISDTDFAAETANFTKSQVLVQAGTTVLYNANQTSQLVLTLLK